MSKSDSAQILTKDALLEQLEIRSASESDLEQMIRIERKSFPTAWSPSTYRNELSNPIAVFLAAQLNGQTIGFSFSWIRPQGLHIMKLAVAPSYRKKRIASELMRKTFFIAQSRESEIAFLEVRKNNVPARLFYQHLGFKVWGTKKGYYTDTKEDALVLVAQLGDLDILEQIE